jgi:hypothetical protein
MSRRLGCGGVSLEQVDARARAEAFDAVPNVENDHDF